MKCIQQNGCIVLTKPNTNSNSQWNSAQCDQDKKDTQPKSDDVSIYAAHPDNVAPVIPQWYITLTSQDCTIEKDAKGWKIRPKTEQKICKISTEVHCDRGNLQEFLEDIENDNETDHASILLKEYLQLLTDSDAKINVILKILSNAMKEHKTFVICGTFPVLRKPLTKRGWLEKKAVRKMIAMAPESYEGLEQIEKLLQTPAYLIWYTNKKANTMRTDQKTLMNKFAGSYFTSKVDMCNNLENVYWYYEAGVSNVQFPRCYNTYQPAKMEEFIQDYYITACVGILKWFLLVCTVAGTDAIWSEHGTIPTNAILFALERCVEYISVQAHEDIDREDYKSMPATAWAQFLEWHYKIINEHAMLKESNKVDINELFSLAECILSAMSKHRTGSQIDGMRNIWILKPGDKSLGRGIILRNSLKDILNKVNQVTRESMQYVIQKYIERPLLVYDTKIDVRQWFLLTNTQPLIVWMYKDILIRFASRNFMLDSFHESIHLCNTTVQLKYRRAAKTNPNLPEELHWNLQNFKDYLESIGQGDAWEKKIRPGIKQNLVGALLASQDNMVNRKNSFQLYGADFVITDDFSVWLIEINTNPRLHPPSSAVTAKLYPEIIEDTMKDLNLIWRSFKNPMFTNMEYVPYHKEIRLGLNTNNHSTVRRQLTTRENTNGQQEVSSLAEQRDKQNDVRKSSNPKRHDVPRQDFYRGKMLSSRQSPDTGQPTPTTKRNYQKPLLSMYETDRMQQRSSIKNSFPAIFQNHTSERRQKTGKSVKSKDSKSQKINKTPKFHQLISPRDTFGTTEKTGYLTDEPRILKLLTDVSDIKEPKPNIYETGIIGFSTSNKPLEVSPVNNVVKEMHVAIQRRVEEAIKNKKIFLIRGDIPYLEDALKKRGWMQKYESTRTRHLPYGTAACLDAPSLGNLHLPDGSLNEKYAIFNALRSTPPNFIWDCRNDFIDWGGHISHDTLLNRFQKSFIYTSKLGMTNILENSHWYSESGVAAVQYPRSYNVIRENAAFIDDYRKTAAVSFLKWFVGNVERGIELVNKGDSPVSPKQIEFAIKRCEEIVNHANHETLDSSEPPVTSQDWDIFLEDYVKTVHEDNGIMELYESCFIEVEHLSLPTLYETAVEVLKRVKSIDPQFELNGMRNIWILKPSNLCCGAGIIMSHKLSHILKRVHDCGRDYFLVQKYIEKPLLVHETKFDVRHWYLVTNSYPLTIWIYNSRRFSFNNYHEAIHICNTAVQNRYTRSKSSIRAQEWDCERLNQYLKDIGYDGEPWYDTILPKMREAIVAIMLAAQDHMDKRTYSFELYGADFMIMDDLSVWLIEINTNPRMHPPSTRITRRLYPDVLESLVKVVMDHPSNPEADTGNFVLAYKQMVTDFQPYLGTSMIVQGKSMSTNSKSRIDQDFQSPIKDLL